MVRQRPAKRQPSGKDALFAHMPEGIKKLHERSRKELREERRRLWYQEKQAGMGETQINATQ